MSHPEIWVTENGGRKPMRHISWDEAVGRMEDALVPDDYSAVPHRAEVEAILRAALGISDDS